MPKTQKAYPYDRFINARGLRCATKINSVAFKKYTRTMWEAANDALLEVKIGHPLPEEIALWLADTIQTMLSNRKSFEFDALRTVGGIKDTKTTTEAKRVAALYKQAVEAGAIVDAKVIDTLCSHFGCDKQTIHTWIRNAPKNMWKKFRPADLQSTRIKALHNKITWAKGIVLQHSKTTKALRNRMK